MAASPDLASAIIATANNIGISPHDLATVMSYETAGTFDPWKAGPTTQHGQHFGLIQWGGPQREQYGVYQGMPVADQVAAAGRYLVDRGVQPGMGLLDVYSAINAGRVGLYNRSDANNGGAPGTVADKVNNQMAGHKAKAAALLGGQYTPSVSSPAVAAAPGAAPSSAPATGMGLLGDAGKPDQPDPQEEQFKGLLAQMMQDGPKQSQGAPDLGLLSSAPAAFRFQPMKRTTRRG